ncbi:hypothetical protein HYE36_06045 [Mycoplasmopsis bovis]|nr:hypothetical protein [Mycoplasmopsis bovis]WHL49588.1 hypothetical protein HYE36_06045 [Mycoplasmopsis bovis]
MILLIYQKENVKQYLKALNEIISEQSELLSSLDSNELGSILRFPV